MNHLFKVTCKTIVTCLLLLAECRATQTFCEDKLPVNRNMLVNGPITIDTDFSVLGNVELANSDETHGNILKNSVLFIHNSGAGSSGAFLGTHAGNLTLSGDNNAGFGNYALTLLTTGRANFAFGPYALFSLQTGTQNSAFGGSAGDALISGNDNTLIGCLAGSAYNGNESGNICIGKGQVGIAGENYTTRIGTDNLTAQTFISGIENVNVGAVAGLVVINGNGQLGTSATNIALNGNAEINGNAQCNGNLNSNGVITQNNVNMAGSFGTSTRIEWARIAADGTLLEHSAGVASATYLAPGVYQITYVPGMNINPIVLISAEIAPISANASVISSDASQVVVKALTNGVDSVFDIVIFGF